MPRAALVIACVLSLFVTATFVAVQTIETTATELVHVSTFTINNTTYLAMACLTAPSIMYQWDAMSGAFLIGPTLTTCECIWAYTFIQAGDNALLLADNSQSPSILYGWNASNASFDEIQTVGIANLFVWITATIGRNTYVATVLQRTGLVHIFQWHPAHNRFAFYQNISVPTRANVGAFVQVGSTALLLVASDGLHTPKYIRTYVDCTRYRKLTCIFLKTLALSHSLYQPNTLPFTHITGIVSVLAADEKTQLFRLVSTIAESTVVSISFFTYQSTTYVALDCSYDTVSVYAYNESSQAFTFTSQLSLSGITVQILMMELDGVPYLINSAEGLSEKKRGHGLVLNFYDH